MQRPTFASRCNKLVFIEIFRFGLVMLERPPIATTIWALLLALMLVGVAGPAQSQPARVARTRVVPDSFALAVRYENSEAVPQDYRRALALYCDAARSGDTRAYFNLGWMYFNGRGVPRDDRAAAYWLQRAASHGVPQAQNLLRLLAGVKPANTGCPRWAAWPISAAGRLPGHLPKPPPIIRAAIDEAADRAGLDDRLLIAVVTVESAFEPWAVSPKGAMGLMQLMPGTAERFGVSDPFDYLENLRGGAAYLNWLLRKFDGNVPLALAAYNAGEQRVIVYGGVPPFPETATYVEEVQRLCKCTSAPNAALK